jgi:hypothetical protein
MASTSSCAWSDSGLEGIPNATSFNVGGVSFSCDTEPSFRQRWGKLGQFVADARHVDLRIRTSNPVEISGARTAPAFESGALWSLFHDADDLVFDFVSLVLGSTPYKRMRVDRDFTNAEISMSSAVLAKHSAVSPLEYPADELLITNHLAARGLGVEVHGCGLIDPIAGGQLFLGHSGAGKSTTTRIWETFAEPEILSDDRIILRLHRGELWMYGTPWHGEAEFASPGKAKLSRIFILQHGRQNEIRQLQKTRAVGEVFARSFPPFHSAAGLERTLEFINRALDLVPCYEFEFIPDRSAVKTVREFHD